MAKSPKAALQARPAHAVSFSNFARQWCGEAQQRSQADEHVDRDRSATRAQRAPGVAEGGARHHRERHGADGADRQCVQRRSRRRPLEEPVDADEREADRQPGIAHVQHEKQRLPRVARPRQRERRSAAASAPAMANAAETSVAGSATHATSAATTMSRHAVSRPSCGAGATTSGRCLASQLRVKLGMMRPPMSEVSATGSPRRCGCQARRCTRCRARAGARADCPRAASPAWRAPAGCANCAPAVSSLATAAISTMSERRDRSAPPPAARAPPSEQRNAPGEPQLASSASGMPRIGRRPVQFGIAVSRKPVTAASAKPNTISCACQNIAGSEPAQHIAVHIGREPDRHGDRRPGGQPAERRAGSRRRRKPGPPPGAARG